MPPHHTAAICGHEVSYDQVNAQVRLRQPLKGPWDDQALRLDEVVEGLEEDGHEPKASEHTRGGGESPVDVLAEAGPTELSALIITYIVISWRTHHPNQKRPMAKEIPPTITLGRRHSGTGIPLFASSLRRYHPCCNKTEIPAKISPKIIPKNVKPD